MTHRYGVGIISSRGKQQESHVCGKTTGVPLAVPVPYGQAGNILPGYRPIFRLSRGGELSFYPQLKLSDLSD